MTDFIYLGIDLAWGPRARTGIAVLDADGRLTASATVVTNDEISAVLDHHVRGDVVAAIDAPLVVANETGRRPCEAEISRLFGAYHAGPHASNLRKPWFQPQPRGAEIALARGWTLDPDARPGTGASCAIEVYPHPAMVSLFGLDRVIPYKNKQGRDFELLAFAFGELMDHMEATLGGVLGLSRSARWLELRSLARGARRKSDLGRIEDEVDAIFCAYLAWMWVNDAFSLQVYGDLASGYIVSPPPPSVPPRRAVAEHRRARTSTARPASLASEFKKTNLSLTQQEADALAAVAAAFYGGDG
ncbi:MAG: DUF429 domain-containing protein [Actinomycetia bacterium]|nr:DUF429 domain-containing protein [Actinomycetes bacterium]